jgi:hypothetical protein
MMREKLHNLNILSSTQLFLLNQGCGHVILEVEISNPHVQFNQQVGKDHLNTKKSSPFNEFYLLHEINDVILAQAFNLAGGLLLDWIGLNICFLISSLK